MKLSKIAFTILASLTATVASHAASVVFSFSVPGVGSLPAGTGGLFSLPLFDPALGTLTQVDTSVELTSIGGSSSFDNESVVSGTVTLTVGTALTNLDFLGSATDLSTFASSSTSSLGIDADNDAAPDFVGVDSATFAPSGTIISNDSDSTTNPADLALYIGPGTFNVNYSSIGLAGASATVSGLADLAQPGFSFTGDITYTYTPVPEPSFAALLLGVAGVVLFVRRRRV